LLKPAFQPLFLRMILFGVCDYLQGVVDKTGPERQAIDPNFETAIIAAVNRKSWEGVHADLA